MNMDLHEDDGNIPNQNNVDDNSFHSYSDVASDGKDSNSSSLNNVDDEGDGYDSERTLDLRDFGLEDAGAPLQRMVQFQGEVIVDSGWNSEEEDDEFKAWSDDEEQKDVEKEKALLQSLYKACQEARFQHVDSEEELEDMLPGSRTSGTAAGLTTWDDVEEDIDSDSDVSSVGYDDVDIEGLVDDVFESSPSCNPAPFETLTLPHPHRPLTVLRFPPSPSDELVTFLALNDPEHAELSPWGKRRDPWNPVGRVIGAVDRSASPSMSSETPNDESSPSASNSGTIYLFLNHVVPFYPFYHASNTTISQPSISSLLQPVQEAQVPHILSPNDSTEASSSGDATPTGYVVGPPTSLPQWVDFIRQVLEGLVFLHERGVAHGGFGNEYVSTATQTTTPMPLFMMDISADSVALDSAGFYSSKPGLLDTSTLQTLRFNRARYPTKYYFSNLEKAKRVGGPGRQSLSRKGSRTSSGLSSPITTSLVSSPTSSITSSLVCSPVSSPTSLRPSHLLSTTLRTKPNPSPRSWSTPLPDGVKDNRSAAGAGAAGDADKEGFRNVDLDMDLGLRTPRPPFTQLSTEVETQVQEPVPSLTLTPTPPMQMQLHPENQSPSPSINQSQNQSQDVSKRSPLTRSQSHFTQAHLGTNANGKGSPSKKGLALLRSFSSQGRLGRTRDGLRTGSIPATPLSFPASLSVSTSTSTSASVSLPASPLSSTSSWSGYPSPIAEVKRKVTKHTKPRTRTKSKSVHPLLQKDVQELGALFEGVVGPAVRGIEEKEKYRRCQHRHRTIDGLEGEGEGENGIETDEVHVKGIVLSEILLELTQSMKSGTISAEDARVKWENGAGRWLRSLKSGRVYVDEERVYDGEVEDESGWVGDEEGDADVEAETLGEIMQRKRAGVKTERQGGEQELDQTNTTRDRRSSLVVDLTEDLDNVEPVALASSTKALLPPEVSVASAIGNGAGTRLADWGEGQEPRPRYAHRSLSGEFTISGIPTIPGLSQAYATSSSQSPNTHRPQVRPHPHSHPRTGNYSRTRVTSRLARGPGRLPTPPPTPRTGHTPESSVDFGRRGVGDGVGVSIGTGLGLGLGFDVGTVEGEAGTALATNAAMTTQMTTQMTTAALVQSTGMATTDRVGNTTSSSSITSFPAVSLPKSSLSTNPMTNNTGTAHMVTSKPASAGTSTQANVNGNENSRATPMGTSNTLTRQRTTSTRNPQRQRRERRERNHHRRRTTSPSFSFGPGAIGLGSGMGAGSGLVPGFEVGKSALEFGYSSETVMGRGYGSERILGGGRHGDGQHGNGGCLAEEMGRGGSGFGFTRTGQQRGIDYDGRDSEVRLQPVGQGDIEKDVKGQAPSLSTLSIQRSISE